MFPLIFNLCRSFRSVTLKVWLFAGLVLFSLLPAARRFWNMQQMVWYFYQQSANCRSVAPLELSRIKKTRVYFLSLSSLAFRDSGICCSSAFSNGVEILTLPRWHSIVRDELFCLSAWSKCKSALWSHPASFSSSLVECLTLKNNFFSVLELCEEVLEECLWKQKRGFLNSHCRV